MIRNLMVNYLQGSVVTDLSNFVLNSTVAFRIQKRRKWR